METVAEVSKVNNDNPLISVIVPAFNIEIYLSECLDSIINQTYSMIEIVVVDDGSIDNTGKIAEEYQAMCPDRVICIHQVNAGVLKARLAGLEASHGEWIGFVDGDDLIESNMYERLLSNAIFHQADISHCGYQTIVNQGERIHYFYNTGKRVELHREEALKELISGQYVEPSLCNKLFRRSLFTGVFENNMLAENFRYNEDLLLNYLLFKNSNKSVYEDICPYHYLVRTNSATRSQFNVHKVLDPLAVKKYILDDVDAELKQEAYKKYVATCLSACDALYGKPEYLGEYNAAKHVLDKYDINSHLLETNATMKLRLFRFSPALYNCLYRIYEKYVQKKVYE